MKFRNPETAEVFDDIRTAVDNFCQMHDCFWSVCPFDEATGGNSCVDWIDDHPHEAARLMGYEVMEDHTKEEDTFFQALKESLEEAVAYKEGRPNHCKVTTVEVEEANMDKPRICEVLGVEVGERFELGNTGIILLVNDDGLLHIGLSQGAHKETDLNVNYLVKAINHPERIIRKPRFTEQEVEDAKAIKRLLTEYTGVKRVEHQWGTNLLLTSEESEEFAIEPKLFPSIKSGQSYTFDEIIGGAE